MTAIEAVATPVEYVRAADLLAYVRAHGWKKLPDLRANGYEFYSPPRPDDSGRPIRVAVPTSEDSADLRDVASRVVSISAAMERRDAASVLADMLVVAVDTIDVRIVPPKGGSRIPLSAAPKLYRSLNELIGAGEDAEFPRSRKETGTGRDAADEHRGRVWLLPAVPRSFAFRIETVSELNTQTQLVHDLRPHIVAPTHGAVCRIVQGLKQSQEASERNDWTGVQPALTMEMCDALIGLHSAVGGHDVEFSHNLSRKLQVPADTGHVGTVQYTARVCQQVVALKDMLTGVPQDAGPMSAKGTIVELRNKRSQRDRDRQLTLDGEVSDYDPDKSLVHIRVLESTGNVQVHNLYFSLPEKQYRDACRAHAEGRPVAVAGKLRFDKNKWVLSRVQSFDVMMRRSRRRKNEDDTAKPD